MNVHLVDGTYELFRAHFGAPPRRAPDGREVGATVGLLHSLLALLTTSGATHVACAFDHVIESFRNAIYAGYKTGDGIPEDLLAQFALAEDGASALGIVVWPMVEFEADDAVASGVARLVTEPAVERVIVCSPDKDFAQLVSGTRVVCWDRRRQIVYDEAQVHAKFGVTPESIPDWLALVGDSADGYPGLAGWGPKSAATVLARYTHLENIPDDPREWGLGTRGVRLAETLRTEREHALLYRRLATLRRDVPLTESLADLAWQGATERLRTFCEMLGDNTLPSRVPRWRAPDVPRSRTTSFFSNLTPVEIGDDWSMADTLDTYRTLTPYLVVPDADAEIRFLTTAFGATEKSVARRPDGEVMHAEIVVGDSLLMLGQANGPWKPLGGALYLWVADVDDFYRKALAAGATSQMSPEDKPYGHRSAGVVDTNGITWWIASPVK